MNDMPTPLIGITINHAYSQKGFNALSILEVYVQAVANAGGAPVLIPLGLSAEILSGIFPRLDGILFTGGGDVHPRYYNGEPHELIHEIDEDRDRTEIQLIQSAVQNRKPFLGICRGIQVINVALGGTLYADILAQKPGSLNHATPDDQPRDFPAHTVTINVDSRLRQILEMDQPQVNSWHHQAVCDLAPGVKATAYAPDGILEAFELPDHPYGLAVQWHPEWMQAQESMRRLFRSFVEAASQNE
jgi:putative glutamine amidotransferase